MILLLLSVLVLLLFGVANIYGQNQQTADVIFTTTNASIQSFNDHDFNIIINNMPSNKDICKSGNCSIEIIKLSENELPTGIISIPDPTTQTMNSGVDIRIHDAANDGMPEMKREFQERWSVWGNCEIADINRQILSVDTKHMIQ